MSHQKRIAKLCSYLTPLSPEDSMPEAGRKILLENFIDMLAREAGSRTGTDIEDVHKMRVAIRRMRSLLRTLKTSYRTKKVRKYQSALSDTASALGGVRDLDVIIANLREYQAGRPEVDAKLFDHIIEQLDARRQKEREQLIDWLDSKSYRRFVKSFSKFLTTTGKGSKEPDSAVTPHQVRHVAPVLFYEKLADVRAFDSVLEDAEVETLHELRIAFKRLRYVVAFFAPVLGSTAEDFVDEIKRMQDYLGRLNDIVVAHEYLDELDELTDRENELLEAYLDQLNTEAQERLQGFPEAWNRFNTRTVQRKLSDSLLVLR